MKDFFLVILLAAISEKLKNPVIPVYNDGYEFIEKLLNTELEF